MTRFARAANPSKSLGSCRSIRKETADALWTPAATPNPDSIIFLPRPPSSTPWHDPRDPPARDFFEFHPPPPVLPAHARNPSARPPLHLPPIAVSRPHLYPTAGDSGVNFA
jgi:hypothetical protein